MKGRDTQGRRVASMRLGILSDTHGLLRREVSEALTGVDLILHAGDIGGPEILERLEELAPVRAVRGNCDGAWAGNLRNTEEWEVSGVRMIMTHRKKDFPDSLTDYDLAVCGHSHQYGETYIGKTLVLNPGCCGPRRPAEAITLALAEHGPEGWRVRRVDIPRGERRNPGRGREEDIRRQIERVIRENSRGRSVAETARRLGMEEETVERILRLHVTHPGVGTEGIMSRMGL